MHSFFHKVKFFNSSKLTFHLKESMDVTGHVLEECKNETAFFWEKEVTKAYTLTFQWQNKTKQKKLIHYVLYFNLLL